MKNSAPIYIFITIFLIVIRNIFNYHPQIDIIISFINLFALLVVIHLITEHILEKVLIRISKSKVPKQIIHREKKNKKNIINLLVYGVFSVFALVYLIFFRSSLGNDIISILALGLSLIDTYLIDTISKNIKL